VHNPGEAEDITKMFSWIFCLEAAQFDPREGNTGVWLIQYAYHRACNRRLHLQGRDSYKKTELEGIVLNPTAF
jgi:RNA polymerase sigma-70 factor (ECF subfamily)